MRKFVAISTLCRKTLVSSNVSKLVSRSLISYLPRAKYGGEHTVSMITGDGIGQEMMSAVEEVFSAAKVPVQFEKVRFDKNFNSDSDLNTAVLSVKRNGVCLKGSLEKSRDNFTNSLNARLRAQLKLDTNVLHCRTFKSIPSKHNLDIVVIRQNTEGEYSMLEHTPIKDVVETTKVITRKKTEEIGHHAFQYAVLHGRKKVTCVHKANIMKKSDGLFLSTMREVASHYEGKVEFDDMIVDNTCMQVALRPSQFDVMVTPNLYGLVIQNIICGLSGGAGLYSGSNYSTDYAVFEPGTRNTGSNMPSNCANPIAMLNASVDMLNFLHLTQHANLIDEAIHTTIEEDKVFTQAYQQEIFKNMPKLNCKKSPPPQPELPNLGGEATTQDVVHNIKEHVKLNIHKLYE